MPASRKTTEAPATSQARGFPRSLCSTTAITYRLNQSYFLHYCLPSDVAEARVECVDGKHVEDPAEDLADGLSRGEEEKELDDDREDSADDQVGEADDDRG